jgi:YfiR/HmsC-like
LTPLRLTLMAKHVGRALPMLILCLALAGHVLILAGPPAQSSADEYQVKAAFLFNFTKFVEWPPEAFSDPDAPFVITVFGDDLLNDSLETVNGKLVHNRRLLIRRVKEVQDIGKSHVLFVGLLAKKELARVLAASEGRSMLTVGEDGVFIQSGGIINFVRENNRLRFEVNVSAAERAGLKISSRLLALARIVSSPAHQGGK